MSLDAKSRLKEIVDSYLEKDGGAAVDTGIVASHLAQMKLFGTRQGVEFFPAQDNFGNQRKDFLDRVIKFGIISCVMDKVFFIFAQLRTTIVVTFFVVTNIEVFIILTASLMK